MPRVSSKALLAGSIALSLSLALAGCPDRETEAAALPEQANGYLYVCSNNDDAGRGSPVGTLYRVQLSAGAPGLS